MSRFKVVVLIVALVVGLASLAACGSSPSQSAGLKTYSSSQFGFSLQYDSRFTENSGVSAQSGSASAAFNIGFLDEKGTIADSKYVDGMLVAVYQLKQSITPAQVPQLKSQLEGLMPQLKAGLQDATLSPLTSTTVNGTPGFKLDYTYTSSGTKLQATTYFLIKGDKEYQLTIQSALDKWSQLQPLMDKTVKSFSVE